MANTSLQIVEVPDFIEESSEYDIKYKRTAKWDAEKGDFVRDGAYRMMECSGEEGFMIGASRLHRRSGIPALPIQMT